MIEWKHVSCELDEGPAPLAAIGLIALASDIVCELELRAFLPRQGVGLYANRIPMPPHATLETLHGMGHSMDKAITGIVPDDHLDVVAYGCTAASTVLGSAFLADKVHTIRGKETGYSDPFLAGLMGLQTLGCRRIALLTPYSDEVNDVVAAKFATHGVEIVRGTTFNRRGDPDMSRVPPVAIRDAAIEIGRDSPVEAVFISCTALRVSGVLEEIEAAINKPLVSSNQAMAWHCLRLAGDRQLLPDRGRLFRLAPFDLREKTLIELR